MTLPSSTARARYTFLELVRVTYPCDYCRAVPGRYCSTITGRSAFGLHEKRGESAWRDGRLSALAEFLSPYFAPGAVFLAAN